MSAPELRGLSVREVIALGAGAGAAAAAFWTGEYVMWRMLLSGPASAPFSADELWRSLGGAARLLLPCTSLVWAASAATFRGISPRWVRFHGVMLAVSWFALGIALLLVAKSFRVMHALIEVGLPFLLGMPGVLIASWGLRAALLKNGSLVRALVLMVLPGCLGLLAIVVAALVV